MADIFIKNEVKLEENSKVKVNNEKAEVFIYYK
jgi:hypothetical protein